MSNKENVIRPGVEWLDENGKKIEAHGGTMYIEDGIFYWVGEDKSRTDGKSKIWTWGIHCYSSRDLYHWKDEGLIVKPEPDNKKSVFYPARKMDRPHLLKNEKTGKYVLWLKYCDTCHFTVLTADAVTGPYHVVQEVFHPYGTKAGDFDLAVDEKTGDGYLYFEADHDKMLGARLTEDYCDVSGEPVVIYEGLRPPLCREAPAHLCKDGKHYIISSGMTGYVPNPSETAVSDEWLGKYRVLGDPHVDDDSRASFNSQISHIFRYPGTELFIAMADRWVPDYMVTKERYEMLYRAIASNFDKSVKCSFKDRIGMFKSPIMGKSNTMRSQYVWLPVVFVNGEPRIRWYDEWRVEDFI